MNVNQQKLEALAEAIVKVSGYLNPESSIHYGRNPGGLPAFFPSHKRDADGLRVFNSMLDGLQALLFDIELKVTGKSKHRLRPNSTLIDLANAYEKPITSAAVWAKFMKHALRNEHINDKLQMSFFLEE